MAFALMVHPGYAAPQEVENDGWEVRVVVDESAHRMRRVRPLFLREPGAPLEAPILGARALHFLEKQDLVGYWPGLGPQGAAAHPVSLSGLGVVRVGEGGSPDEVDGRMLSRQALQGTPGARWVNPESGEPVWAVLLDREGESVMTLRDPWSFPLVPDVVDERAEEVLWILKYGSDGDVAWALALGSVESRTDHLWQAFWRRPGIGAEAPMDLDEALKIIPTHLIRHVRSRHRTTAPMRPFSVLRASLNGLRYNQVEGGSFLLPFWVNVTPIVELRAWTRFSTTSYALSGGAGLVVDRWPGRWGVEAFRQLEDATLWESAHRKGNSLQALLRGRDDGHYYTQSGASLWAERRHGAFTWRVDLFAVSDRMAPPMTDYAVFPREDEAPGPILEAEDSDYYGLRAEFERQRGLALEDGVILTRVWWEVAGGERRYVTLGAFVEGLRSRKWWALAARVGGGRVFGDAPMQREYFLGGATTVRGFDPATLEGSALILGRLEAGFGPPTLRLVLFGDLGWTGEPKAIGRIGAVGAGLSLAEGMLRMDLAKAVSGGVGLKFYLAGNGLL